MRKMGNERENEKEGFSHESHQARAVTDRTDGQRERERKVKKRNEGVSSCKEMRKSGGNRPINHHRARRLPRTGCVGGSSWLLVVLLLLLLYDQAPFIPSLPK